MRRTYRALGLSALVLALVLALSACSGPEGQTPTVPSAGDTSEASAPVETTAPETAPLADAPAGTSVGLSYYPDGGFNPFTCTKLANRAIMSLLYQRLFVVTADYQAEPELCAQWSHSDDMRTWTFQLAEASFTDGTAVTAADVKASLEAARDSTVYGSRFFHVAEITAEGTDTVVMTMDTPYELTPMLLDVPIVRAKDVAEERPMGSGPYALQGSGDNMTLVRKAGWVGRCLLNQKTVPLYAASSTAEVRDSFEFGGTSMAYTDPGSASYVDYRCDYELYDCPTGIMLYLACNTNTGLFADREVREALTYAIDRDALVESPYNGFARAASLASDPASPFYDTTLAAKYGYKPEKFVSVIREKLLAGSSVTILVDGSKAYRVEAANQIKTMLEYAGLQVEVDEMTGRAYEETLLAWNFDLHLGETRLSPTGDLSQFFRPWGDLSYAGMSDPELYDACLDTLENSGNYYNLHQAIQSDGRLCPILFRTYAVYVNRGALPDIAPAMDCILRLEPEAAPAEEEAP